MHDILVVEKNPFFSKILISLVEYYGYKTKSCFYPEYLPELLDDQGHGIMLVNFHEENQELIRNLNAVSGCKVSIILLSDYFDKQLESEAFYQKVYAYLIKPRGIIYLKEILEKANTQSETGWISPQHALNYDFGHDLAQELPVNKAKKIGNY